MKAVSVVGLGKLGACLAASIASKGNTVIGVDQNQTVIDHINAGRAPVQEPGLSDLITAHRSRLSATASFDEAVSNSEVTFIIVPTPSDPAGGFSLTYVLKACADVGRVLAKKKDYHLVVLTSTVLPGATEADVIPALEKASGKICGKDFGLCYNPEFIALGDVIRGLLRPDMVLIGQHDEKAGELLQRWYEGYCENSPKVSRMNLVNAELTKLSVNTYVTTKITFANMLLDICMGLPGADVDTVSNALGLDSRIGRKYLTGAFGYGGPCFPRDNKALAYLANRVGADPSLAEATDRVNSGIVNRFLSRVKRLMPANAKVAVLGLAYKPDTTVVEESQGLVLAETMAKSGFDVIVHDPLAMESARKALGNRVRYAATLKECLDGADILIVTIPCREYQALQPADFSPSSRQRVIVDCWRVLRGRFQDKPGFRYVPLGVGGDFSPQR